MFFLKKTTLRTRLSVYTGLAVLAAGSLVAYMLLSMQLGEHRDLLRERAAWVAGSTAQLAVGPIAENDISSLDRLVRTLAALDPPGHEWAGDLRAGYLDVLGIDGLTLVAVEGGPGDAGRSAVAEAVAKFGREGEAFQGDVRLPDGKGFAVVSVPVLMDGTRVGTVRTAIGFAPTSELIGQPLATAAAVVLAMVVLSVLLAWRLSASVSREIEALSGWAAGISSGSVEEGEDVSASREFEGLTGSFKEMAESLREKVDNLARSRQEAEELTKKLSTSYEESRLSAERLQEANEWVTDLAFRLEEANQELKAEKIQTETIVHSIREGLVGLDKYGKIILINPEAEEIFEVREDEVKGAAVQVLVNKLMDKVEEPAEFLDKFIAATSSPTMESEFNVTITKPFRRVLNRSSSAIRDDSGELIGRVVTFRDVTREKEVDEMKTNFVSTVSHELRTPLTSIKGALNLLLAGQIEDSETSREFLKIAEQNTDRLISLITNLLDLSRMEEGRVRMKFRKLDLNAVARSAVKSGSILAKQNWVSLEAAYSDKALKILGDREKLEQMVANLVGNALKFSDPGGVVRVRTRLDDDEVRLVVEDEGIGIPPEKLDKVFDRFYQVDMSATRRIGGTGLGLAICRAIVKEHAGKIWAESPVTPEGRGTRFVVTIPRLELSVGGGPSAVHTTEREHVVSGGNKLVLIVDDDPTMLELHKKVFEVEGYRVLIAATGSDALRTARESHPGLIVLDVMLPDMDGFDVASILKADEATSDIPILFASGLGEKARRRGMDLGSGYLSKPFGEESLLMEVKKILR